MIKELGKICNQLVTRRAEACFNSRVMLDAMTSNLERYMDLLSARQKLVASNIANADTPGYQSKDIDFQAEFASLTRGQQPLATNVEGLKDKPDGNNVNLDREARLLAENAIRFNLATTLVRGQLKQVRDAIQEGKSA
jgi:flagellar basal-body rod protein FlgB